MSDSEFRDASQLRISNTGWGGGGGGVLGVEDGGDRREDQSAPAQSQRVRL